MFVSDSDGMKSGFDLTPPVIEEIPKDGEFRSDVIMLVNEQLNQRRMIGHVIADLDRAQAIALKLPEEITIAPLADFPTPGIRDEAAAAHLLLLG